MTTGNSDVSQMLRNVSTIEPFSSARPLAEVIMRILISHSSGGAGA